MAAWTLHFDGLYEPRYTDRGIATYGYLVRHGDEIVQQDRGLVAGPGGIASANVGEYGAMIQGLTWLRDHAHERDAKCAVHVRGDSRLAIETVAGRWKLTSPVLLPLRDLAIALAAEVRVASFEKVPRDANAEADQLSREAYHELAAAHPEWGLRKGRSPRPERL